MTTGDRRCPFASRRALLAATAGLAGAIVSHRARADAAPATPAERVPFRGRHQAGILTPQQSHVYFAAFDVTTPQRDALITLLRSWTDAAERPHRRHHRRALERGSGPARRRFRGGARPRPGPAHADLRLRAGIVRAQRRRPLRPRRAPAGAALLLLIPLATPRPAYAWWNHWHGWHGGPGFYPGPGPLAGAVAGAAIGLGVGAAIASVVHPAYLPPPVVYTAPPVMAYAPPPVAYAAPPPGYYAPPPGQP